MNCNPNVVNLQDTVASSLDICSQSCVLLPINLICNQLIVPPSEIILGNQYNKNANIKIFYLPVSDINKENWTNKQFYILTDQNGVTNKIQIKGENIEITDTYIKLKWIVDDVTLGNAGEIKVQIEVFGDNYQYYSNPTTFTVSSSIDADNEIISNYPTILQQIQEALKNTLTDIEYSRTEGNVIYYTLYYADGTTKDLAFYTSANGLPSGGLKGQILSKKTDQDYDTEWVNLENNFVEDVKVNGNSVVENNIANIDLTGYAKKAEIPTKNSQLENDEGYLKNIPTASTSELGGIKVGKNLSITEDGTLNAEGSTIDYNNIENKPILNSLNTVTLETNENEIISGIINLHKISKTGSYSDLNNKPSLDFIPNSEKGTANGVATLGQDTRIDKNQLPTDTVYDSNYVHTDNNFTTDLKNKLNGIEDNAQVNKIETIKVNDNTLQIINKAVNIEVPTKTSNLENDSGFITNTVDNLTNYYLKSETYTQSEVNNLIGQIKTISIEVVDTLPTTGEDNKIYLVPKEGSTGDIYNEYIWVNNAWELIGTTQVDLTGYATEDWVNAQIKDFVNESQVTQIVNNSLTNYYTKTETYNKTEVNNLLSSKADTSAIPTKVSELENDKGYLTEIPIASATVLGGIKVGNNLSITTDGVLNAEAGGVSSYNDLTDKPTLNTNVTTSQPVSESETITGEMVLHKISKTGDYGDLNNKPTIPTKTSDLTNDSDFTTKKYVDDIVGNINTLLSEV